MQDDESAEASVSITVGENHEKVPKLRDFQDYSDLIAL